MRCDWYPLIVDPKGLGRKSFSDSVVRYKELESHYISDFEDVLEN